MQSPSMVNTQRKTPPNRVRTRCLLGLIFALAYGFSVTNIAVAVSQRIGLLQPQQTHLKDEVNKQPVSIYDGEFITKILRGEEAFPGNDNGNNNTRLPRLKYLPGTLNMTRAESLQHCFVNVTHYKNHFENYLLVLLSDRYKLIYRNIPKSSSSTGRKYMSDYFEGENVMMKLDDIKDKVNEGYRLISFVREPLDRFYSSYDEAYLRTGPWMDNGTRPKLREMYLDNKWKADKYPYLYEGLTTIQGFRRLYCPEEILARCNVHDLDCIACNKAQSIDDGNLANRFEQFIRDYNGLDPFDLHLNLQVCKLVSSIGEPLPITTFYNATEAEKGWQEIAHEVEVEVPNGEKTHARKTTRRFNMSAVSVSAKRKICRLLALDYCCLNFELPKVCSEDNVVEDETVYCAMQQRDENLMKYVSESFVIQAWNDP